MPRYWLAVFRAQDARSSVTRAAELGTGYVWLRIRNHSRAVGAGDPVAFWVQDDDVAGAYAVGRIFAQPEWTVVRGDPDEDEYVVRQIVWLEYLLVADQVTLARHVVASNPAFAEFEPFALAEAGNPYSLTEQQWRILFRSVARYCRRHGDGAARTQTRRKY